MLAFPRAKSATITNGRVKARTRACPRLEVLENRKLLSYVYTLLDRPGATRPIFTALVMPGQISGYSTNASASHGFLLSGGQSTDLRIPRGQGTERMYGINAFSGAAGSYEDFNGTAHAVEWSGPQAVGVVVEPANLKSSTIYDIGDIDQVVGEYTDQSDQDHAFVTDPGGAGTVTILQVPGATTTRAYGLSESNQMIVGSYNTPSHGFLATSNDYFQSSINYTTLDVPGASETVANGVNDLGQVVGQYTAGNTHGFVLTNGEIPKLSTFRDQLPRRHPG